MGALLLQLFEAFHQVVAHLTGILHQLLLLHHVEHGQSGCTGQMVAAKGGAELSVFGLEVGRDEHGSHGETVADALGTGDEVGTDAEPLVGKEASAAAVAALNLIGDEHSTIVMAELLQPLGKLLTHELNAAHALDALDDAGADIALGQFLPPGLQIVEGQIGGVAVGVDGGDDLRVVGHLYGQ